MLQFITLNTSVCSNTVSGERVESKIKYITKKKVFKKFYSNTQPFLLSLISYYATMGYLSNKQYEYLDKYYTIAREKF